MALPTRPLRDMLPLVIPYAPGCPDYTAIQALRVAAITFCERTRIWREILTVSLTGEDEAIVTPDHAALHEIEQAFFGDDQTPLEPVRFADTTAFDRSSVDPIGATPSYITQVSANSVSVIPFAAGQLTVYAILKPYSGPEQGVSGAVVKQEVQNVIPAFLFQQYSHVIAAGALSRLLRMPTVTWTDPKAAMIYAAEFDAAATASFNKEIRGQHRAVTRATPQWL